MVLPLMLNAMQDADVMISARDRNVEKIPEPGLTIR